MFEQEKKSVKVSGIDQKSGGNNDAIQLQDNRPKPVVQKKSNNTGLPDNLKSGIENLSGHSMDDVKVHYNSYKPAQLNAHAYAQGTDIHLASGQEKHLPHEAWHVVQQKQGRVKPTMQMKGKVNVNDDAGLEKEADVMGAKALQQGVSSVQFMSMDGFGFNDMNYSLMSSEEYGNWKGTLQGKFDLHAASEFGDRFVVTQFKNPEAVLQMVGFLPSGIKGGLLIAEGLLTIAGGIAGTLLSGGVGLVPGILAIGVGAVKIGRGVLTIYAGEHPTGTEKAIMDALRGIEAVVALIGGAVTGNLPAIVFGISKSVRSLATAIADYMGNDTAHPIIRKALLELATACHAIEVIAGVAGGISGLATASTVSGADNHLMKTVAGTAFVVAGSKTVRATDQGKAAHDAHPEVGSPMALGLRNLGNMLPVPRLNTAQQ